jgi:hypothetical protein
MTRHRLASLPSLSTVSVAGVAIATIVVLAAGSACSSFDANALTYATGPDYSQFAESSSNSNGQPIYGVSVVLERRCGTLDCHGQVGRPLRIYGQYGLRFVDDAGDVPGLQPTTANERLANYQAVVGLQPELMTEVVQGNAPPEDLMLLRKPLQLERHKGGAVFVTGDDGDTCILSWLAGQTNFTSCTNAVAQ